MNNIIENMKPLLVNTYDVGGAANACIRLHKSLLDSNINSNLLVLNKSKSSIPNSYSCRDEHSISFSKKLSNKFLRILSELHLYENKLSEESLFMINRNKNLSYFSFPSTKYDITKSVHYKQSDIVNLHWVANFLDYASFFEKNAKPIVWTLHDMAPFSGGEHYEESYVGIDDKGFPIKRILTQNEIKTNNKNLISKQKALKNIKSLNIVALSKWLESEAKKSILFSNFNIFHIPNSVNTLVFKQRDKKYSRELLGLPEDKIIILFVAASVNDKRKGFEYVLRAIPKLQKKDICFCAVGEINEVTTKLSNVHYLGKIYDEILMSIIYSACDLFVIPSIMDNLPNTVVESLCCGTPVVGFSVGGIPDMIENNINGLLCNQISVENLSETIDTAIGLLNIFDKNSISKDAHERYNQKVQANAYKNLFERILKS